LPLATRFGRMLDHLHAPSKMVLDPPLSSARVSLIYPQMLKARELLGRSFQHQRHQGSVLEVRRVHPRALSIIPSVSTSKWRFVPLNFFAPSYPCTPPTLVVFTDWVSRIPALGWGSRPALVRILSRKTALIFCQVCLLFAPHPEVVVVVHRRARRELTWKHAPLLAAASQEVEDGVEDLGRRPLLRGRPPGLAGGISGAKISHSGSERSLGYRQRDEDIRELQKPSVLLIKPHYLPSRTASSCRQVVR
jgi:hypothetical protein